MVDLAQLFQHLLYYRNFRALMLEGTEFYFRSLFPRGNLEKKNIIAFIIARTVSR